MSPVGVEVRTFYEGLIAPGYLLQSQGAQAPYAEVFADEGANDVAMNDAALDILDSVAIIWPWLSGWEIAKQTARKGIAGSCRIDNLF